MIVAIYFLVAMFVGLVSMAFYEDQHGGGEAALGNVLGSLFFALFWPIIAAGILLAVAVVLVVAVFDWMDSAV